MNLSRVECWWLGDAQTETRMLAQEEGQLTSLLVVNEAQHRIHLLSELYGFVLPKKENLGDM